MVLPRTPIVLSKLAEDMEYEVKRIFEVNQLTQPRINNFYYSNERRCYFKKKLFINGFEIEFDMGLIL